MNEVTTIKQGIKTRLSTVLGSSYTEMSHTVNVEDNNVKGNSQRYGVIAGPLSQSEDSGTIGFFTVDQTFTIKLINTYSTKPTSDSAQTDAQDELMDLALEIFKDLKNERAGSPALVMQTMNLEVDDPEVIEGSKVAVITFNVTIKYRKRL